ncbi:MAG: hypothetical protein AAF676_11290 [Pseudomonadota bacterium]
MNTYIVTSNGDDDGPGLTLREAIALANASPGADVIEFDGGAFSGGRDNVIRLSETLEITDSVTIDASRVAGVVVSGDAAGNDELKPGFITDVDATGLNDLADNVRVLQIIGEVGSVVLNGLTVTGGRAGPGMIAPGFGGGIYHRDGELTIIDGAVSGNVIETTERSAGSGGGIYSSPRFDFFNAPDEGIWLTLLNSSVEGNRILGEWPASHGGGVWARWTRIYESTIADNQSGSHGGGVFASYQGDFRNATIFGNVSELGFGGGVAGPNNLRFINSTITGNEVRGVRPDGFLGRGGGVSTVTGTLDDEQVSREVVEIVNSIIIGNSDLMTPETSDLLFNRDTVKPSIKATLLFEGVNVINNFSEPTKVERRGPILERPTSSIFEDAEPQLRDNGGGVKTVKLRSGSSNPAVDASQDFAPDRDATGRAAQDFPGQGFDTDLPGIRDLGAYELPLLRGGLPVVKPGTNRADRMKAAAEAELFELGRGADRVQGRTGQLDGDVVDGFGFDDVLRVKKARFEAGDISVSKGSLVLEIDVNGRGGPEATVTLEGEFGRVAVLADRAGRDTDLTLAKLWRGKNKRDRKQGDDEARDVMDGRGGNDALDGLGGDDVLRGGAGRDRLSGGRGDDLLEGGAGRDVLSGGAGRDAFRFERGFGKDRITDFDPRRDGLDFSGHRGVDGFGDLKVRKAGDDVKVTDGQGGQVLIEDAKVRQIDRDLFEF